MKRIIASLLALLLLTAALTACASRGPSDGTTAPGDTTTTDPAGSEPDDTEYAHGFLYYGADISQYCTIPASAYAALSLSPDVTDDDVNEYVKDRLLPSVRIPVEITDRAIADGDTVNIYFKGYIDDVAFDGGSNMEAEEPAELVIGSDSLIPGFEDGLLGVIPAETSKESPVRVSATFPDPYTSSPDLAGKTAIFEVWIVSIIDHYDTPTELTNELVLNELGFETEEEDAVAALLAYLKSQMRTDIEENLTSYIRQDVSDILIEAATFTGFPEGELAFYRAFNIDQIQSNIDYNNQIYNLRYGVDCFASFDEGARYYLGLSEDGDWSACLDEMCELVVKENLVLYAVARNEGYTVTQEMFDAELAAIAEENGLTTDEVLLQVGETYVYNQLVYEAVYGLILEKALIDYGDLTVTLETE